MANDPLQQIELTTTLFLPPSPIKKRGGNFGVWMFLALLGGGIFGAEVGQLWKYGRLGPMPLGVVTQVSLFDNGNLPSQLGEISILPTVSWSIKEVLELTNGRVEIYFDQSGKRVGFSLPVKAGDELFKRELQPQTEAVPNTGVIAAPLATNIFKGRRYVGISPSQSERKGVFSVKGLIFGINGLYREKNRLDRVPISAVNTGESIINQSSARIGTVKVSEVGIEISGDFSRFVYTLGDYRPEAGRVLAKLAVPTAWIFGDPQEIPLNYPMIRKVFSESPTVQILSFVDDNGIGMVVGIETTIDEEVAKELYRELATIWGREAIKRGGSLGWEAFIEPTTDPVDIMVNDEVIRIVGDGETAMRLVAKKDLVVFSNRELRLNLSTEIEEVQCGKNGSSLIALANLVEENLFFSQSPQATIPFSEMAISNSTITWCWYEGLP